MIVPRYIVSWNEIHLVIIQINISLCLQIRADQMAGSFDSLPVGAGRDLVSAISNSKCITDH